MSLNPPIVTTMATPAKIKAERESTTAQIIAHVSISATLQARRQRPPMGEDEGPDDHQNQRQHRHGETDIGGRELEPDVEKTPVGT